MKAESGMERVREALQRICNADLDSPTLRYEVAALVRRAIPFDAWCCSTADPQTHLVSSVVAENPALSDLQRFFTIEYGEADLNCQLNLARGKPAMGTLSETAAGDLRRSTRWREILGPAGLGDELRVALIADGSCWGYFELFREPVSGPFTSPESQFLLGISRSLAVALRRSLVSRPVASAPTQAPPATVIIASDMTVLASSPQADRWLLALAPARRGLPPAVYAVAARLRTLKPDLRSSGATCVRVPVGTGEWLSIYASPLRGPKAEGAIALTLQPTPPVEMAPLILAAHGLTWRERQVAQLVLDGCSNAEVGHRLGISTYTVQDHVKAVLDKVGMHTKQAFVAHLLGNPAPR